jgi:glycosyltransferase involved in cell wall biosynthesis
MRVAFLDGVPLTYGGGYENFIINAGLFGQKRGHEIEILVGPQLLTRVIGRPLGLKVRKQLTEDEVRLKVGNISVTGGSIGQLKRALRRADLVYVKNEPHELSFAIAASKRGAVIAGFHSAIEGRMGLKGRVRSWPYRSALYGALLRRARGVHVLQEGHLKHVVADLGIERDRVGFISNGVDLGVFTPPSDDAIDYQTCRILYVGRLDAGKGIDTLLTATDLLPDTSGIEISIAGDGPSRAEVERAVNHNRRLSYLGHVPDLTEVYQDHHFLVAPSRYEVSPLAPAEASASGLPLILSDIPAHQIYRKSETTTFIPGGNPDALCEALIESCRRQSLDVNEYKLKRKKARAFAEGHLDEQQKMDELFNFLERLGGTA